MCVCVYIYIYTCVPIHLSLSLYIYIYIYTHTHEITEDVGIRILSPADRSRASLGAAATPLRDFLL